ncbi:MAG: sigma-54-dependent Fis family transcriptional regulator [Planctomycetota bacterium]
MQQTHAIDNWLPILLASADPAGAADPAAAAAGAVCSEGAHAAAVLRATPPDWTLLAKHPADASPPTDLAAEAMDRGGPASAGDWFAVPLKGPAGGGRSPSASAAVSDGVVLLVRAAADRRPALLDHAISAAQLLSFALHAQDSTRRADQVERLLEATKSWRAAADVRSLLEQIAQSACGLFGCDRASIFLWDKPNRQLVGRPALGVEGGELRVPDDAGVVGEVLRSGRPSRVSPQDDGTIDRATDQKTGYQTDTLLCVPLIDRGGGGELLGVFELLNKRGGAFTDADQRGLADLADYAAVALTATQQFEELLERHEQMVDQAASGARMIGGCPAIEALRATIGRVADTDLAILILGENGCGKEVVARMLHYQSRRRSEPFVAVNCAAIAETLLESELFGHEKGAFTDANESRPGKFELAAGGTILLDEIGDMSLGGQAKLLRVLEEKTVVRVGGGVPIETDVRVLAATNQDLAALVRERKFREDLYFRLNVVSIDLPPLRRRGEDILLLAEHFLQQFCGGMGRKTPRFTAAARKRMLAHRWPGNVRELRNMMERVAYLSPGSKIDAEDLAFTLSPGREADGDLIDSGMPLGDATHTFQEQYIRSAIKHAAGNVSQAAKQLGVHRSNLYRKMKQLGMDVEEPTNQPDA